MSCSPAVLRALLLAVAMAASGCTQTLEGPGGAPILPGVDDDDAAPSDDDDATDNGLDPNADADGDGIPDAQEGDGDADGDGTPDYLDDDADGNGIPDAQEGDGDHDGDGIIDAHDTDDDGDGIPDTTEIDGNPGAPPDSDSDGVPDYLDIDSDADGISDAIEGDRDADSDGVPNYLDLDSDSDGLTDAQENIAGPGDADGDGFGDFEDSDADNDGMPDGVEVNQGTDPYDRDTDGDGFGDSAEIAVGTDPDDPGSVIDGYYAELAARSEATITVPFTPSVLQADVLFLLDSTCSMTGVLDTMANNFSQVVAGISIPDVSMGVAEFDDYAYGSWFTTMGIAAAGDKPFRLRQQITSNYGSVQSTLAALGVRDGADEPESSMEALYQAATGVGYDQDCDNNYDAATDVPPFLTGGSAGFPDAFGGGVGGSYSAGVPGTGPLGGAGFRAGSVPIIVYTTDNLMRDPDAGYSVPGVCSDPAGSGDVASAVNTMGGKLIGIGTTGLPISQMTALANATGSTADIDGNGTEEPLVFQGTSNATVSFVLDGVEAIAGGSTWDLTLVVQDDPYDFVLSTVPEVHTNVAINTQVTFDVTLFPGVPQGSTEEVFIFPMQLLGDGTSVLAEWDLVLVVLPGS